MLVIGLSSAALATEDPVDEHSAINEFLNKMDYGFTAVFTFEMIIKVFYFYKRLPLNECKQKYAYMDSSFKNDFKSIVASETIREKYKYILWYLNGKIYEKSVLSHNM